MAGGRWDPKLRGAAYTPDEAPDVDDITPAEHYAEQLATVERQLGGEQDPERRARLQRDRAEWARLLEAEKRDEHWTAGEGDRTLF